MTEISKEYLALFSAITDTAEILEKLRIRLLMTQERAEELYLERCENQLP